MQRLIFINRFFFPDHSATSQILADLTFHLAERGRNVHVITSRQRYDDPHALLPSEEKIRGVHVHRISTTRFGRMHLVGRGFDYFSFYISLRSALLELAESGDVIIAKTDPPLLSIPAMSIARRKGAHLINWLQDLYPEIASSLGVPYIRGPVRLALISQRNRSLRFAVMNIAVGHKMAALVRASGVEESKIDVIPNWTNEEELVPIPSADNPFRKAWTLNDKFVVGYSGNLGRAHEVDTIIGAAEHLKGDPRIVFLFIGGGHSFDELVRRVKLRKIDHIFKFMSYQPRELLKYSLGIPDLHLLSLRPEVEGLIVPSKFYGIAAAGRPILAIAAKDGEFGPVIEQYRCGLVIEPGQPAALADAIFGLSNNATQCAAMGERARVMLETEFPRFKAFELWRDILDRVERSGSAVRA